MVRSTSSCFNIITCGRDSVDEDDLDRTESKGSTDRRGWSFRKRSSRHRVLSNNVMSETPSTGDKESPGSTSIDSLAKSNPTIPEKNSVSQWKDETSPLSTAMNTIVADPLTASENACQVNPLISTESTGKDDSLITTVSTVQDDSLITAVTTGKDDSLITTVNGSNTTHNLEESVAIVIQSAIRRYLAQKELYKLKSVVKLQAVVRGHLVRKQAVGTLRCVQALVKMQDLVRSRYTRMSLREPVIEDKQYEKQGQENSGTKESTNYPSTEKWLSNSFARQLLESTPKGKKINIKCDSSRPNSAWKWLERWMSLSSDFSQLHKPQFCPGYQEQEGIDTTSEVRTEIPAELITESVDLNSTVQKKAMPLDGAENLIAHDADNFDFQDCCSTSSPRGDIQQPQPDDVGFINVPDTASAIKTSQTDVQSNTISQTVSTSISNKHQADREESKQCLKRVAPEQPETDGKKYVSGSRKACNPSFVAVQSKFEELSSSATSGRSMNSACQGFGEESKLDSLSSPTDSVTRITELSLQENSTSQEPIVHVGISECVTDLSIFPTCNSPDKSEVGGRDLVHEPNRTIDSESLGDQNVKAKIHSSELAPISSYPASIPQGKLEDINGEFVESVVAEDFLQVAQQPERSALDLQPLLGTPTDQQTYRASPEGSPRSHVTVPNSHGTPSPMSVKTKRNKLDKSVPTQSRKSQSVDKRSPLSPYHDSGARSSTDQLPKDLKKGKRRNSFDSARTDHVDQEPRDSNGNSLPSYMQATESARAKAHANPRSSPDMQDKDIYIKKRHSLPGANGKQGSPRLQQSTSQVQHSTKGNGTSTNEKKWQR